jgi:hypothetical protein
MSGAVRSSSGLLADALLAARESVVRWLARARASGQHDLADAVAESVARVATLAMNDPLKAMHKAGVATGRIAVCLALGLAPPDGPETVACPHCGRDITAL